MIVRHKPLGSGHPYTADTDQRTPTLPVAGEALLIGARVTGAATSVTVTVEQRSATASLSTETLACARVARSSRGQNVDGGHLASAQAKLARDDGGWQAELVVNPAAVSLSYVITAVDAEGAETSTTTYATEVGAWGGAVDSLVATRGDGPGVVPGSVRALRTPTRIARVSFDLPLAGGERVAGFGERFDRLDHVGTTLDARVFEQYKSQGAHRRTYMPMPFAHVVGGTGWGFHVETSRRTWFDVGAADARAIRVEAQTDAALDSGTALSVATWVGSPAEVLDGFLDDVGRPEELPEWVFGLWASGNEWNTQREVERQAALHREHGIPISSLVIEAWSDEQTFTAFRDAEYTPSADGLPLQLADFTFPAEGAWPDPKAMVDGLHADGVRLLLWQIPLMKMRPHPQGQARHDADAMIREDVVIKEPSSRGLRPYRNRGWWFPLSLMPDLTDERAATWWRDKRRYLVEELGIDGFKTDGGEHAWGDELAYLDGRDGQQVNNLYPVAYAKAYGDLLRSAGKAPVTFSRAGFTGSQAHGAFWAGDENSTWEAFRWSMWAGLSASACGVLYWGWDIAGFSGDIPDPELYVRAFAASAFVPVMQYHSEFNHHRLPSRDRTPWNIAERHGDPAVIGEIREIVELRQRLVPYLAEGARVAIRASRPLMRPLFFDYPDDPDAWTVEPQWMLGDDVLVAPVLAPGSSWRVYLPAGTWRNAWTGEAVEGPTTVATDTPRHRVPVYVADSAWGRLSPVFE